jgi:Zn-dependent M28 family amino/carboxypeptidase
MIAAAAVFACVALAACGGDDADGGETSAAGPLAFDENRAFADLEAQVAFGPRPSGSQANKEMTKFLAQQLREAGVRQVRIQRPWRNVVGTIPGRAKGSVVVSAHHDTKDDPPIVGANDGASGVAVVLELARALPDKLKGPSLRIALFDAEEARGDKRFEKDGTRGSRQYVSYAEREKQATPPLDSIRAMVLFDLVGDCDLHIPYEPLSDAGLYDLFAAAAAQINGAGNPAPFGGTQSAVGDDHIPFRDAGIPAVDLIDFHYGPGPAPGDYWHTLEDTVDKVCPASLDAVGEAALVAIPKIR